MRLLSSASISFLLCCKGKLTNALKTDFHQSHTIANMGLK